MNIYGQKYNREELLKRNNLAALFGVRRVELTEGRGARHKLIEVKTTAGLRATFSESQCLDILDLEYRGINLGFLNKNGIALTATPEAGSFTKYWSGGFLLTCGLRNVGPPCEVDGETFPLHGHIGATPADSVNINVDENDIIITGKVRETALFGHCLEMERKIIIPSDGSKITVSDIVHNLTPEDEAVFLLYHINFGFPFLSEDLVLNLPTADVRARDAISQERISEYSKISPPIDGEPEAVFFHTNVEKNANVSLSNPRLGISANVSYDSTKLPVLAQWKCMRSGDYALGIEPSTSYVRGREEELKNGYNINVPAFGKLEFGFTIDLKDIH